MVVLYNYMGRPVKKKIWGAMNYFLSGNFVVSRNLYLSWLQEGILRSQAISFCPSRKHTQATVKSFRGGFTSSSCTHPWENGYAEKRHRR